MKQFQGFNGRLYAVSEPYKLRNVPLHDCGDGWDWRAPDGLFYWLPEDLSFEVWPGEYAVGAVEVHCRSGRAGFGKCLSGMDVRVSGECLPTALIGEGADWQLSISTIVSDATTLGSSSVQTKAKTVGTTVQINGIACEPIEDDEVLVWLPAGEDGVFVGVGRARVLRNSVHVAIDTEGVTYGYR